MAQHPAMPLWTDALLADCGHLDDGPFGLYIKVLLAMWRSPAQRLPNDDEWLARRFSRSVERVRAELRPLIDEFCQCDGNWITQKRLSREFLFVTKQRRAQSERAKSRWRKQKADAGASLRHMPPHPHPHHKNHTVTTTESDAARKANGHGVNGGGGGGLIQDWRPSPELLARLKSQRPDLTKSIIDQRTIEWRQFAVENGAPRRLASAWFAFLLKTPKAVSRGFQL